MFKLNNRLPYSEDEVNRICKNEISKNSWYKKRKNFDCCVTLFIDSKKIICIGHNKNKTHPSVKLHVDNNRKSIHAEMDGLIQLNRNKYMDNITDIFSFRGRNFSRNSFPCVYCMAYLKKYMSGRKLWFYNHNELNYIFI